MKSNPFNSFSPKALALAAVSVAALASCSKDQLSQEIADNGSYSQATGISAKATGEYIVVMKDGTEISSGKRGLPYGRQLEVVRNMAKAVLKENGINGIELNDNNTFASLSNGFTARLSKSQLEALKNDDRVAYIEEDMLVAMGKPTSASTTGTGKGKTKTTDTNTETGGTTTETGGTTTETNTGGTTTETPTAETTTTGGTEPVITDNTAVSTQIVCWGVNKIGGTTDGTGKTAWIIDSGIDINHSDLNVDKTRSKSFLATTQAGTPSSFTDEFGHGTQVAGVIGAKNNNYGACGVAAGATLVSLRVMDANGSAYVSKIVAALNHVAFYGQAGDVVNLSLGVPPSTTLDDAVRKVAAKGIFVAIASGNSGADCTNNSPARVNATNVFTVSAMNSLGIFESYSNYGAPVDYAAPGTNIYTTAKGGGYVKSGGTSMAAPHVAGILLVTNGSPKASGFVTGDKDNTPDPIVSK